MVILAAIYAEENQRPWTTRCQLDTSGLTPFPLQPSQRLGAVDQGGQGAIKWTRLSCRCFAANAVRRLLRALAYNLGYFMRALAMPKTGEPWSLTSLRG